jgi:hypothetical protein
MATTREAKLTALISDILKSESVTMTRNMRSYVRGKLYVILKRKAGAA